jgi:hypothetical protein
VKRGNRSNWRRAFIANRLSLVDIPNARIVNQQKSATGMPTELDCLSKEIEEFAKQEEE